MGILDPKERVLDTILTEEGRSQLATGEIKFRYATFTDLHTFYEGDTSGVATPASDRIMLEAHSRYSDRIVPIADDDGNTLQFQYGDLKFFGTSVLSGTSAEEPEGGEILTQALLAYMTGSIDNFKLNYVIGEFDEFDSQIDFSIGSGRDIEFATYFNSREFTDLGGSSVLGMYRFGRTAYLDSQPSLFEDPDLNDFLNYAYLPPLDADGSSLESTSRASFVKLGEGYATRTRSVENSQYEELTLSSRTSGPDLLLQFFEKSNDGDDSYSKLSFVDLGLIEASRNDGPVIVRRYLVGKVFTDSKGRDTYVNIFTLDLE